MLTEPENPLEQGFQLILRKIFSNFGGLFIIGLTRPNLNNDKKKGEIKR